MNEPSRKTAWFQAAIEKLEQSVEIIEHGGQFARMLLFVVFRVLLKLRGRLELPHLLEPKYIPFWNIVQRIFILPSANPWFPQGGYSL